MFSFQGASRQRKLHILRCASFRSMTGRFAPCVMSRFWTSSFRTCPELSLNEVLNPLRTSFNESSSFFAPRGPNRSPAQRVRSGKGRTAPSVDLAVPAPPNDPWRCSDATPLRGTRMRFAHPSPGPVQDWGQQRQKAAPRLGCCFLELMAGLEPATC